MCKTYDAIYELRKNVESNILICFLNHFKIEGELHSCQDKKDGKCYEDVVTLENAKITCPQTGYEKNYRWINIPSMYIQSFAFKCCEME